MKALLSHPARLGLLCFMVLLLAACTGTRQRMDNQFSELQLREVIETAEGLQLQLRLSNFGQKPFEVEQVDFTLSIEGQPPIRMSQSMALTVSGWGTEPLSFSALGARLGSASADAELRYRLTGVITRKGFGGSFAIEHSGLLSPVPGVSGAWR
jgi:hypothetical protein